MATAQQTLPALRSLTKKLGISIGVYLSRLDRFPLDKAGLYLRLKEAHGMNEHGSWPFQDYGRRGASIEPF